jgi:hypothetical protein
MKQWGRTIFSLIMVAVIVIVASGGMVTAQSGGNYFDKITVGGDVDIYGTGVIRDSLSDTVRAQVTSGGLTVAGAVNSPNITGGYTGNAIGGSNYGSVIAGGGRVADPNNWSLGINTITGNYAAISGGTANNVVGNWGAVGGGAGNRIFQYAYYGVIGGGATNSVSGQLSTIGGGNGNAIGGIESVIGGGYANWIDSSTDAVIAGGAYNYTAPGSGQAILGGELNTIGTGRDGHGFYSGGVQGSLPEHRWPYSFLDDMNGSASGDFSTIAGGGYNAIGDAYSFIGSGYENWVAGYHQRTVTAPWELYDTEGCITTTLSIACPSTYNTVVGGKWNYISNAYVSNLGVEEGVNLYCQTDGFAFIGGGTENTIEGITAQASAIAGGHSNTITSTYGFIGGGITNTVTGLYSVIPGGQSNTASGESSFAAGTRAKALHKGAFVWADSQEADYESLAADTFNVRAQGGVRMDTSGAGLTLDGPVIVDGMTFTYTAPITITGVLTNVRLLYYQVP